MEVRLMSCTPDIEGAIVEMARVSSSRSDKRSDGAGLLRYLIKHKHWSPFEMGVLTFEIETSKAVAIQLIRHRSFSFQELSQRYQDVGGMFEDMFEEVEIRKQSVDNRQSSEEVFDPIVEGNYDTIQEDAEASVLIREYLKTSEGLYRALLDYGVAREQARMILPMCTKTRLYMSGTVRSWIHFFSVRDEEHSQKEMQEVARSIKELFIKELPVVSEALGYKG